MKHENITAKKLRNNMTPQEKKLWYYLRNRQIYNCRFRRQSPIGNYIVDFICREKKLIIEIDGGQHNEDKNILYDQKRTEFLQSQGYTVIRFWNNEINDNIEGVLNEIAKYLKNSPTG
ncbi:MAG TPA: DNA (cytosine-5-)-methyltransferase [Cyanobacteria bacterium UBA11991]|nr:endonuclease domain-containing protein [Cyanobacteriota bacterium]MDY6359262.1 endonuclease domain-containing protein [Cyanobacteriota bacterium]MDY6364543.1 endonuclease domain-containing protein [Cyanobacteriota bacterium]MDY6383480.1 endonuclease domain-containing protein [Cyanobacteriota bacterium]HCB11674.1 DNA (cytosine-5-)-methyltransferase [Cyanobacteria bacterium UBA11991]